jgi:hypothetical protein
MASLSLSIPDTLFIAYKQLMRSRGKTVEDGCREYLATLLISDEHGRKDAQFRLMSGLPPSSQTTNLISQSYPRKSRAGI